MKSFFERLSSSALALLFVVSIVSATSPTLVSAFGSGTGTTGDPIHIDDCSDLMDLADNIDAEADLTKAYVLTASINCSAENNFVMIGSQANFTGVFDGGNYTITVDLSLVGENHAALFRIIGAGGIVRNLTVAGEVDSDSDYVGLLAASVEGGTITNVHTTGTVTAVGSFVGGVTGQAGCVLLL